MKKSIALFLCIALTVSLLAACTGGGGGGTGVRGTHGRARIRVPPRERVRQVVPSQLQQRRRHVVPQHRPRLAHPGTRSRGDRDARVHRRRGGEVHFLPACGA